MIENPSHAEFKRIINELDRQIARSNQEIAQKKTRTPADRKEYERTYCSLLDARAKYAAWRVRQRQAKRKGAPSND